MNISPFPYTTEEGDQITEIAKGLVNAGFADDEPKRAQRLSQLHDCLQKLIGKYGEHPTLIELQADFADTFEEGMSLYQKAKQISMSLGLSIRSICLSMAVLVLREKDAKGEAREFLQECQNEMGDANEYELWKLEEINAACNATTSSKGRL